ncbi:MAG: abortive infection system antitoxin AbiGi family protein [Desulfobulbaceae bacterium]
MTIRSEFLVHWTGSDIESHGNKNKPELYLKRLLDDYANGLFAKRTDEAVVRRMTLKGIIRWCFTEIRLSQADQHAERFGRLGIGFTREFIMGKGGRPVIYIPFDAADSSRLLEDSIRRVHDNSARDSDVQRSARYIMAHVKRMGDGPATYEHFEEMEWRMLIGVE